MFGQNEPFRLYSAFRCTLNVIWIFFRQTIWLQITMKTLSEGFLRFLRTYNFIVQEKQSSSPFAYESEEMSKWVSFAILWEVDDILTSWLFDRNTRFHLKAIEFIELSGLTMCRTKTHWNLWAGRQAMRPEIPVGTNHLRYSINGFLKSCSESSHPFVGKPILFD